ncbi:MAG TPA: carboxylesterase family protein [Polyangiales bacterium]|nr:carboxylesterase family protein [Polyangiales bacterium]
MTLAVVACLHGCESDEGGTDESPSKGSPAAAGSGASVGVLTNKIMTAAGPVVGEVAHEDDKQILIFRGVPYAAAPTGDLRWKPPQPHAKWTDERPATEWGNRCPQGESTLSSPGPMSEDCLNLNVLTPATKASERLPVMVFFHGGGLTVGTGNSATYCHTALPARGVVVVTVNSRLGSFGYFSHPALAKESDKDSSGNYGTLDLIASLEWVQKNITAFGGDPKNVTIFGESGGGSKVLSCMASPLAKGLFHRAIIESGSRSSSPNGTTARANAEQAGQRVVAKLGIQEGADVLEQMRAKSWEDVLAASTAMDVMAAPNLTIDGWVLPQSVNEAFAQGKQSDVPLIVGANEGEVGEFTGTVPTLADSMKSVSSKAYVYNFVHVPAGWRMPGCYAFHGLELVYVFGHLAGIQGATIVYLGSSMRCDPMKDPQVSDEDKLVATNTMKIWSQFAKTGNPSVPGLIDWPAYTAESDQYLEIGGELKVKTGAATSAKMPGAGATTP